jgi:hypothetical protein
VFCNVNNPLKYFGSDEYAEYFRCDEYANILDVEPGRTSTAWHRRSLCCNDVVRSAPSSRAVYKRCVQYVLFMFSVIGFLSPTSWAVDDRIVCYYSWTLTEIGMCRKV